jgi:PAS domain S-box-containing protein
MGRVDMTNNLNNIDLSLFCKYSVNPIIITKASFDGPNNPEILYVNDALCKMSGYSFEEVVGQSPKIFQGPKSNRFLLNHLKENLTNGKPFEGFTINYKKDGSEYFVEWNISPVKNENGEIVYYFGLQRDRTDSIQHQAYLENKIKSIEDEKALQEEKLKEYQKSAFMGEMIDSIAHQWSQPLTILKGNIEHLDMAISDESLNHIHNFQNTALDNLDHLMETLEEFRSFFRPDKKKVNFKVSSIITSSLKLLSDQLTHDKILIETKIESDFSLVGYPNEFKHILINLINNSKDAFILNKIKERKVIIGTMIEDDNQSLFVCDNAGGVPENIISEIFDKNFTTKERIGGTGIGLYMTKQIIEKIGGKITAHNINDGVCFVIEFKRTYNGI